MLWLLACSADPGTFRTPDSPAVSSADTAETPDSAHGSEPGPVPGNVLVLLSDDQGIDKVAIYGAHEVPPPTPNIDALARRGRLFRNAWASPVCSPSRASLLTGRMPRHTGVGTVLQTWMATQLPLSEVLLPELLADADPPWASAAIGKWHLAGFQSPSGRRHPNDQGFDRFVGTLGNLYDTVVPDQPVPGYYDWERIVDGVPEKETRYATTVTVDDALDAIAELPEPWLVYVAFHAPHEPLDPPPAELAPTFGALPRTAPRVVRYHAMVEALDTEIGRLLDSVDADVLARTTVFFLSDNGTPPHAVLPPLDPHRAKITLFEGGVRVPFVVAGPLVEQPGTETDALVHVIDLFPTLAEIARVPVDDLPIDGISLLPLLRDPDAPFRDVVHTESFTPIGPPGPDGYTYDARASRDDLYKVMEFANDGAIGIFDVRDGLDDGSPRLPTDFEGEERERVDALVAAHRAYWASLASGP